QALALSNPEAALKAFDHALAVASNSGNRFWAMMASSHVAALHMRIGDSVAALRAFRKTFEASGRSADLGFALVGLTALTLALQRAGELVAAATLLGFVSPRFDIRSMPEPVLEGIASLKQELRAADFAQATSAGAAMTQREIENYAREQIER